MTNDIIVLDFETGSVNPSDCEVLQLAAIPINGRNLEIYPNQKFNMYIQPEDFSRVQDEALKVNKINLEDLKKAPLKKHVWEEFTNFVNQFNYRKSPYTAPILAGYNIRNFDEIIINRLCAEFKNVDKNGKPDLFYRLFRLDLIDIVFMWFENVRDLENYKLDTIRKYFKLDASKAHDALFDTQQTAELLVRFLKLHRNLWGKVPAFKKDVITRQ